MKIVYNEEKTVARMSDAGKWYGKARARRNRALLFNLILILSIMAIVAAYYSTGNSMSSATGISLIIALGFNILSTIMVAKSVPKNLTSICPAEAWYHVLSNEYTILEVYAKKEDNRCSVSVVFDVNGEARTLGLGTYDIKESSEVNEETLDLEQEVVFIPV